MFLGLTFGHHKCRDGRSSHCRADSIALLGCVDPAVPAAPSLGGSKHTTSAAHLDQSQGRLTTYEVINYYVPNACSDSVVRQPSVPAYDSRHTVTGHRVRRKLHHHCKSFDWVCLPQHIQNYKKGRRKKWNFSSCQKDTFPKAPWPERWVPPPLTRGIRATALPVPQDSALVWWPEMN